MQTKPTTDNQLLSRLSQAVSRLFHAPRARVIVLGCDARIRLLVTELGAIGREVSLIKPATGAMAQSKPPPGVSVVHSTTLGLVALERAGARYTNCLVAATTDDALNFRLCREARDSFGVPLVIARLQLLDGVAGWARVNDAGMDRMTWSDTVRLILGDLHPSATLSHLAAVSDQEQIVDLGMQSVVFLGRKVADLPLSGCEVLALTRMGIPVVDLGSTDLHMNDVLTMAGTEASLKSIREALASL